jgi:hypothetical protein
MRGAYNMFEDGGDPEKVYWKGVLNIQLPVCCFGFLIIVLAVLN